MKQASQQFTPEGRERINEAVREGESKTSAEIVPVVATASGRYDRAEDVFGLWMGLVAIVLVWVLFPAGGGAERTGIWGGGSPISPWWKLVAMLAAAVIVFVVGAVVAAKVGWLRRLFTPGAQMEEEVFTRARQAFFDSQIHHTAGATGLLVYVSLYERRAAVLADASILEKVGQGALDAICAQLTSDVASEGVTPALCKAVRAAGEKLAPALPRADDDVNELADALVTIDA